MEIELKESIKMHMNRTVKLTRELLQSLYRKEL